MVVHEFVTKTIMLFFYTRYFVMNKINMLAKFYLTCMYGIGILTKKSYTKPIDICFETDYKL